MPTFVKIFLLVLLFVYVYVAITTTTSSFSSGCASSSASSSSSSRSRSAAVLTPYGMPSALPQAASAPRATIIIVRQQSPAPSDIGNSAPSPPAQRYCPECSSPLAASPSSARAERAGEGGSPHASASCSANAPASLRQRRSPPQLSEVLANLDEILEANGMLPAVAAPGNDPAQH